LFRLQDILLPLKAGCNSLLQLLKSIGTRFIGFFKKNPTFVAPTVAAFATFVIAIYAIFTYGVQRELKQLQANMVAMQTEPRLSGSAGHNVYVDRKTPYYYRLTNTGSDTAWSIFADMRALILCDTLVIYDTWFYLLPPLRLTHGTLRGQFSRWNKIAPAQAKEFGCDRVREDFQRLSAMLRGVILLEADFVYWSDSPVKKFEEVEYFIYNKQVPIWSANFEKLTRPKDQFLHQLNSLIDARKIAHTTSVGQIGGPAFYRDLFDPELMLILKNAVPSASPHDYPWTYRDTLIVFDSTIQDFVEYRRQFPEYLRYERWLDSR
jgi:hypothetical protein